MSDKQLNKMSNFSANYEKILDTIQQAEKRMNFLHQIRKPRLSDIELIAVDLTSEYMSIDSEHQLFRILPSHLREKIEPAYTTEESEGCSTTRSSFGRSYPALFRRTGIAIL